MKGNISKNLSAMVARATFSTMKSGVKHNLLDHLFLEMISFESSLAFESLGSLLESWQLYKLRQMVERSEVTTDDEGDVFRPELYYASFLSDLVESHVQSEKITSLHALHAISLDTKSATSQALRSLGILPHHLQQRLVGETIGLELSLQQQAQQGGVSEGILEVSKEHTPHPLDKFGVELTELARRGKIDSVVGREREIERVVQILSRRKKNNPILIGEAGVGKSAVVEGLALRMVSQDVPHHLVGRRLYSLDLSSLVAGTKFRGEFEERVKKLLDALRADEDSIIFIDEIHTIVGAGSSQGSLDVANILKPALSRGELRVIGATTLDEYRRDIEGDSALVRRFQKILLEPTTSSQTLEILQNIAPHYESHHRVRYTPEALRACVELSVRYITSSHLPDKAIDLLDEAGALRHSTSHEGQDIVVEDIERVVSMMTGIPAQRLAQSERGRLKALGSHLHSLVVGQGDAVDSVTRTIQRSRVGLRDERRPIGTFLFVGPTGVGKTLLAKELARWMFDTHNSIKRVDMSEYSLSHSVSRLIGSPPGYVGYNEGGELTEPVRREPYSVVLLDEIEKAHPDIFNLLLQLLDEGHLTDGAGRRVDFRNTIIIMTSNVGSRKISQSTPRIGYGVGKERAEGGRVEYEKALKQIFPPEFLNRIDDTIIFNELRLEDIEHIVDLELRDILRRVEGLGYNIRVTASARKELAQMGYHRDYGARSLRRTLIEELENPISSMILGAEIECGGTIVVEKCRLKSGVRLKVA